MNDSLDIAGVTLAMQRTVQSLRYRWSQVSSEYSWSIGFEEAKKVLKDLSLQITFLESIEPLVLSGERPFASGDTDRPGFKEAAIAIGDTLDNVSKSGEQWDFRSTLAATVFQFSRNAAEVYGDVKAGANKAADALPFVAIIVIGFVILFIFK